MSSRWQSSPIHLILTPPSLWSTGGEAHGRATRRDSRSRRSRARSQGRPRMKPGSQPIETPACPLALSCLAPVPGGRDARRRPGRRARGRGRFSSAYEGGPEVKQRFGLVYRHGARAVLGFRAALSFLSPPSRGIRQMGTSLRWRNLFAGRQAANAWEAPLGAKASLRVSTCQIECASRRASSTWATRGPRWRPSRRLVRS